MGQLIIKQLKNRWGDISFYRRCAVGIDRAKMKLYNLEESAQKQYVEDKSEKNNTNPDEIDWSKKTNKDKFAKVLDFDDE